MYVSHTERHIYKCAGIQVNNPTPIKISRVFPSDCSILNCLIIKKRANED